MSKRTRYLINQILVVVISVSMLFALQGCGNTETTEPASSKASFVATSQAYGGGEFDMGGYEIRIAWEKTAYDQGNSTPLAKTSPTYQEELVQIKNIEQKYNCKFKYLPVPDLHVKFPVWAMAGDDQADAATVHTFWAVPKYQAESYCLPVEDYIDITLPIWKKELLAFHHYNGHYYGVPDPFTNMDVPYQAVFFNKKLFEKEGFPDLYELQKNKEWTWDKALELARAATKDTNGDGKIDQWGWAEGWWASGVALADQLLASNGAGYAIFNKETGKVEFGLDRPEALEALNWAYDMVNVHKVVVKGGAEWVTGYGEFMQGRVAMISNYAQYGDDFKRKMKNPFGIVAFPRGPRIEDVVNAIHGPYSYIIPTGSKHPDWTGKVITELCEPQEWRDPIYLYDNYCIDKEGIESCEYMAERSVYTWQEMIPSFQTQHESFNFSGIHYLMYGSETPASYAASIKGKVQTEIDELFKDVDPAALEGLSGNKE